MITQHIRQARNAPARTRRAFPGAATGLWIGLAAAGVLGVAPQAWAGARLARLDPQATAPSPSIRMTAPASGRIFLAVNLEDAGDLSLAGTGEVNDADLFAKVGNRRGLASSVRTETRDGELWLATATPAEATETRFARRDPASTAFQGGPASVASR